MNLTPQAPSLEEQIFQNKKSEFMKELDLLQRKLRVALVPVINQGPLGQILPDMIVCSEAQLKQLTGSEIPPLEAVAQEPMNTVAN